MVIEIGPSFSSVVGSFFWVMVKALPRNSVNNTFIDILLAYFPHIEEMKVGLCNHLSVYTSLCLCMPSHYFFNN
jgi:hypothetical protein